MGINGGGTKPAVKWFMMFWHNVPNLDYIL